MRSIRAARRAGAAQVDEGQSHFCRNRHLGVAERGATGLCRGLAGSDHAAVGPKDVKLPTGVQADIRIVAKTIAGRLAALGRCRAGKHGTQPGRSHITQCPRLAQRGLRALDAGVRLCCFKHKPVQSGIVKPRPPLNQGRRVRDLSSLRNRPVWRYFNAGRGPCHRLH